MPDNDHYVIIGNGPAGNHAAIALRKKDKQARITIISDECIPFYYKPRLTDFIADKTTEKNLLVTPPASYKKLDIRIRLGQRVANIHLDSKSILLQHMEKINYTKLIIASGSRAKILPSMTSYADHLNFITAYTDVMEYKKQIGRADKFFILGADLVGFKFLKLLANMGKTITFMIDPDSFWPFDLTDDMLDKILTSLSKLNISIIIDDTITNITPLKNAFEVTTGKGIKKTIDMVFSFNGLIPNIEFAKGTGIDIDHGILVNEYLKTNTDDIYACGSCAQIYNPGIKRYTTSIGWPNAVAQGEVAALNLLGDHRVIKSADKKYFDLQGVKIKTTWWEDIDDE